jgi:hypothetical protein
MKTAVRQTEVSKKGLIPVTHDQELHVGGITLKFVHTPGAFVHIVTWVTTVRAYCQLGAHRQVVHTNADVTLKSKERNHNPSTRKSFTSRPQHLP